MPKSVKGTASIAALPEIDLGDRQYYLNREISWLEFNHRVLQEAMDARNPLLERVKFAAIFSSNLDEFFMVRVASLKQQVEADVVTLSADGLTPQQQLEAISQHLHPMVTQLQELFENDLRPQLAAAGVYILTYKDLNADQKAYLQDYFERWLFPILTPLAVDPSHPFPVMASLSLNLAIVVKDPETKQKNFARVKVPNSLPRFVPLPEGLHPKSTHPVNSAFVTLEEIIAHHLDTLFPGMEILEQHLFRITRDADLGVQEDEADDLLLAIQQELRRRHFGGSVVRLQVPPTISEFVRKTLMMGLRVTEPEVYEAQGWLGLRDLMSFLSLPLPHLKDEPWNPVIPAALKTLHEERQDGDLGEDIFGVIQQGDILVHHPYESFAASVEHFITQAAHDPQVQAIKMTLYRTSGDSPIAKALITAAAHRKQVVALVEIKARFDEESNINWARELEEAGVHVVYGVMGLKTHTKVVLVVRQEEDQLRRYVHIGTGNYNSKTAKLYTDLGLLSCREDLGADLTDLFNYLTGFSKQKAFRKLLVAPVTLRDRMTALIRREITHCQQGHPGRIIAKMNALVDPTLIKVLYEASQTGVQIDLIIRGMCCLKPGVSGVSDNIRIVSVVGRFLEHSRIFYFHNQGQEEVFIGSADWMRRNLDRRVEAVTPIEDSKLATELKEILQILLQDNRQAWELHSDGSYMRRYPAPEEDEISAQSYLMKRFSCQQIKSS
ncbi:MAG: polyphosphate kinase 1 [Oculatellaceae cyanobacterium Prado106]|jgi:polyphosphate kinase|nr:polyphosphate kinase 1 [Oculatellaceae cyanobacterium Prado106]